MVQSTYNNVFEEFKLYFPEVYKRSIDWYPSGRGEITIKLDDDSKIIFNSVTSTIRNVTWSNGDMSEECWRREFGIRLSNAMHYRGISQGELSDISDISRVTIGKYINGNATPSIYNIAKLARALECSINELTDVN